MKTFTILVALLIAFPALADEPVTLTPDEQRIALPIRDSKVGICDCPYDFKSDYDRCGAGAAYCLAGGREPTCYGPKDQADIEKNCHPVSGR